MDFVLSLINLKLSLGERESVWLSAPDISSADNSGGIGRRFLIRAELSMVHHQGWWPSWQGCEVKFPPSLCGCKFEFAYYSNFREMDAE